MVVVPEFLPFRSLRMPSFRSPSSRGLVPVPLRGTTCLPPLVVKSHTNVQKSLRIFSKPAANCVEMDGFHATAWQGRLYLGTNSCMTRGRRSSKSQSTTFPEPVPVAITRGLAGNGYHCKHLSCATLALIRTTRNARLRWVVSAGDVAIGSNVSFVTPEDAVTSNKRNVSAPTAKRDGSCGDHCTTVRLLMGDRKDR